MSRYVAFLRGVNLGAKRRASGEDLRAAFGAAGFEDVATFRTSGNVVFGDASGKGRGEGPAGAKKRAIVAAAEAALREALGFDVSVVLRSDREVAAIAAREPFAPEIVAATEGRLQVLLMAKKPAAAIRRRVLALASEDDRLDLHGRELYWLPRAGTRDSKLDQEALGSLLGLVTMRTKGTIEQLAARFFATQPPA